jgi:hypothetical protein
LGVYYWVDFGMVLSSFGIPFLLLGVRLPSCYLKVQNRNNQIYWVNVGEYKTEHLIYLIEDMIDLIENYKRILIEDCRSRKLDRLPTALS